MVLSDSGEKSAQIKHCLQAKTVQNSSKQICGWILMWETTGDGLFHWRMRYNGLWTHVLSWSNSLKLKCLIMDLFLKNVQLFTSQDVTDGLEWCGLLWCFYQLFGLSFWRHPFTAEDPLRSKWCNDTFLRKWGLFSQPFRFLASFIILFKHILSPNPHTDCMDQTPLTGMFSNA